MQEAENIVYYGSLEAAARFGGRLGLRQQANIPEHQGPRTASFEDHLERMADPLPPEAPLPPRVETKLTQWGRCGFVPETR